MKFKDYIKESMQRYCNIYKAKNKKWYLELADQEYGEYYDATTYGPFNSMENAEDYLDNFSNPGGLGIDDSGDTPTPKKSPNGKPIQKPQTQRRYGGYRYR